SRKIVIAVALLVAGFAVLFSVGLKGSLVYYLTVSEFKEKQGRSDLGEHFRVNGNVLAGSIQRHQGAPGARFVLTDGKSQLAGVYKRGGRHRLVDGAEGVVEGSPGRAATSAAAPPRAKSPPKYEPKTRLKAPASSPADGAAPPR